MKDPKVEAIKEILRWLLLLAVSGLLDMLPFFPTHLLPETVMIGSIAFPMRNFAVVYILPAIGRWADKYKHEQSKERGYAGTARPGGFIPF